MCEPLSFMGFASLIFHIFDFCVSYVLRAEYFHHRLNTMNSNIVQASGQLFMK